MLTPVYDIVNCGPRHRFVANGKLVHNSDSVNFQNLPSRNPLKKALKNSLMAPEGYVVVNSDSSQIEARVLAWWAGQEDVVQAFRDKRDVYCEDASKVYGRTITKADPFERAVGKATRLSLGFGTGHLKLRHTLKTQPPGADLPEDECKRLVTAWRDANSEIVALWKDCDNALQQMIMGVKRPFPLGNHKIVWVDSEGIKLPNGLHIRYPNLRLEDSKPVYDSRKGPVNIWGGAMVENCIAAGTPVLTRRGWVNIEDIQQSDEVHDGVEFVSHDGVVFKSVQPCVTVDGVSMTPDHEVLTNDGWQTAGQRPEPYRPNLWHVDSPASGTEQREALALAVPVYVRESDSLARGRCQTGRENSLRMPKTCGEEKHYPWYEQPSCLRGMAQYVRPLQASFTSGMEELWRAWNNCLQSVAGGVPVFLGGHGAKLSAWDGLGSYRQRRPVFSAELPLGFTPGQHDEQTGNYPHSGRTSVECRNRDIPEYAVLPAATRVDSRSATPRSGSAQPVYDIMNCGPRHRFVVRGASGPFVVHNCVQALARIIIGEQMVKIQNMMQAQELPGIALTVHDSVVNILPEEVVEPAIAFIQDVMSTAPTWAGDLPITCEIKYAKSYGGC